MINKERLIKTFLDIVQIDSPSGFEQAMVEDVTTRLSSMGYIYAIDEFGNIITHVEGEGDPIFLSAHLDTVEPGRGITPIIEDGVIRSQGATILGGDNKTAVAGLLELLAALSESSTQTRSLEIAFTLSEEVGNYGAINLDYSRIRATHGYTFDGSGPIGTIITASPFYNRFDITIYGKEAHAAKPHIAVNALSVVNQSLNTIRLGKIDDFSVANIGVIDGGNVRNTIPGEVVVRGEVRSFKELNLINHSNHIATAFEVSARESGGRVAIDFVRENGGYYLDGESVVLNHARESIKNLDIQIHEVEAWGCADANIFIDHGIDVVNLGYGVVGSHTTDEHISVSELENLGNLMLQLVVVRP